MVIESIDVVPPRAQWLLRAVALLAGIFGALTVRAGALAVFGHVDVGNVVPFVLWFNFLAGIAYLVAAFGLWAMRPWAVWLSAAIAASTAVVFMMFGVHVASGGAFETRTWVALTVRTVSWCAIAWLGHRWLLGDDDHR